LVHHVSQLSLDIDVLHQHRFDGSRTVRSENS
jgi:hypothetical protein